MKSIEGRKHDQVVVIVEKESIYEYSKHCKIMYWHEKFEKICIEGFSVAGRALFIAP